VIKNLWLILNTNLVMRELQMRTAAFELYKIRPSVYELCVLHGHAYQIYQSIVSILPQNGLVYDECVDSIFFAARSVKSLAKVLHVHKCITEVMGIEIARGIGMQMSALQKHLFGFGGFDVADILFVQVEEEKWVGICVGSRYLFPLSSDQRSLEVPGLQFVPAFCGAEWSRATSATPLTELRCEQTSEALGALIVFALYGYHQPGMPLLGWATNAENLTRNTKMHGFIARCAQRSPHVLYI
jgi:hypothetical protein